MASLEIPDELLLEAGLTEADALLELACRLFEMGRLDLPTAARLARLDRNSMEDALLSRRIPIYKPTIADIVSDLKTLDWQQESKPGAKRSGAPDPEARS